MNKETSILETIPATAEMKETFQPEDRIDFYNSPEFRKHKLDVK